MLKRGKRRAEEAIVDAAKGGKEKEQRRGHTEREREGEGEGLGKSYPKWIESLSISSYFRIYSILFYDSITRMRKKMLAVILYGYYK